MAGPKAIWSNYSKGIDGIVSTEDLRNISRKITRADRNDLGRLLGLSEQKIDEIDVECQMNKYGDAEVIYKCLDKWKQIKGTEATKAALREILHKLNLKEAADLLPN